MAQWTRTIDALPPEGEVVDTISDGGIQQTLKRKGRLWFIPDGSMYVYYEPKFWRAPPREPGADRGHKTSPATARGDGEG